MKKWIIAAAGVVVLSVPAVLVLALTLAFFTVFNPGAVGKGGAAICMPSLSAPGGSLTVAASDGEEVALDAARMQHVVSLLEGAAQAKANPKAQLILVMGALAESRMRMYANSTAVPESVNYPHDADGSDHDSIGLLQQRPSVGWGSVKDLMDAKFNALAFLGGPGGPNGGSPPGLFDIAGWESMTPNDAAQRVQGSATPNAYGRWEMAAKQLIAAVGGGTSGSGCAATSASGEGGYPFTEPQPITDGVGPRGCPVSSGSGCAASTWHPALDFGAACGTPVLAIRPGTVTTLSGYWLGITTPDGTEVAYLHMFMEDVIVKVGDIVSVGQQVGAVGTAGPSSGCHLDIRVTTLGSTDAAVLSLPHVGGSSTAAGYVDPQAYMALYGVDLGATPYAA